MHAAAEQNRDRCRGWLFSVDNRQVLEVGGEIAMSLHEQLDHCPSILLVAVDSPF
jgi:hypothetical protein